MTADKLQTKALAKLGMQKNATHINVEQLRIVATKPVCELTEDDLTQLKTFCELSSTQLKGVTFYGNATINPNIWDRKLYTKSPIHGWVEHYSTKKD